MSRKFELIKSDFKIISRDPMLIMCLFAPVLLILVAVLLLPILSNLSKEYLSFSIDAYLPIIKLFLFPLTPMLFGLIYGFILLDERDSGIISYLEITPLGKSGYLLIRILIPVILSLITGFLYLYITGFTSQLSVLKLILLSIIVSTQAPLMLLFLGAFASNKVEGIAISKGFGIIMLPMLIDYFLKGNWRIFLSISPLWWVERAVFNPTNQWLFICGAALSHFILIVLLFKRFQKKFG